jgi:hypothetical protein
VQLPEDIEISNCIFNDACYNDGELHLATNLGLHRYNPLTQILTSIYSQQPVYNVIYEELDDIFLLNSSNQILAYQKGTVPNILYSVNDSIRQLLLLYNK